MAAATVLLSQPYLVSFLPGHHGWVSSHYLAILEHTGPETRWVGYTLGVAEASHRVRYDYFNRYPVLGTMLHRAPTLGLADRLEARIHLSRQFMNLVFLLTMASSYFVLDRIVRKRTVAMASVLFTYSGYYFLFYKDMIFAEQVSILGSLIAVLAIERYYRNRSGWQLFGMLALALSIGRGFTVLPLLVLWFGFEAVRRAASARRPAMEGARASALGASGRGLLLGLLLTAASTAYNISAEAAANRVPLAETSIVEAAVRRGGFNGDYNEQTRDERGWTRFLSSQVDRGRLLFFPVPSVLQRLMGTRISASPCDRLLCSLSVPAVILLGLVCLFHRRRSWWTPGRGFVAVALLGYGFAWLLPARNLTIWHDYTAIYYFGLPLLLYGMIANRLPRKLAPLLLVACFVGFVLNISDVDAVKRRLAERYNWITEDFQAIADHLPPGQVLYFDGPHRKFLSSTPFVSGFYLPDQYVTDDPELADFVVRLRPRDFRDVLTPENRRIFLFPSAGAGRGASVPSPSVRPPRRGGRAVTPSGGRTARSPRASAPAPTPTHSPAAGRR
jgi:hypothetical protein